MRLSLLTAGAALLLCQSAAIAQTKTTPSANDSTAAPAANATTNAPTSLRSHLGDSLQKAGFSDIKVVPSSFVISAKDKDGNPVFMTVTPDFSPRFLNWAVKARNRRRDRKTRRQHLRGPSSYRSPITTN